MEKIKMTSENYGGKRPGAGRKKGFKREKMWKTEQEMSTKYQTSPLDYLLAVLNNPISSPERKMYAAERAAPYVHARVATTTKLATDKPLEIKVKWED
jgi:hypothetical protein|tara:strand:+ start:101 stop:394 length:294 start_codon:yes stop_codon:yes gene_type:complete